MIAFEIFNYSTTEYALADLLGRLAVKGVPNIARDYIEQLLRAFAAQPSSPQPQPAKPPTAQAGMIEPLTRREQQVLELLAQRMTAQEIAQKLVLSDQTVKRHRANVYQKLGVHSRRDAIAMAVALGIRPGAQAGSGAADCHRDLSPLSY